jgi:hypothetical protein
MSWLVKVQRHSSTVCQSLSRFGSGVALDVLNCVNPLLSRPSVANAALKFRDWDVRCEVLQKGNIGLEDTAEATLCQWVISPLTWCSRLMMSVVLLQKLIVARVPGLT